MWTLLAVFCTRRAIARAESRIITAVWDRHLSLTVDRLRIALEALERVRDERVAR